MVTVNIIGGGIGGLTMANALYLEDIDFHLYEQAPALTEVGAAIGISKAALDILKTLGLEQQVKNAGSITQHLHFANKDLKVIRAISSEWPGVIIHRARLIDILSSRIPKEKIHLNKKLTHVVNEQEFTQLYFSDGSEIRSTCTIIADGIQSFVRKQIFPEIKIRSARQTIWRGITNIHLPAEYSNTYTEIWDNSKRFLFAPMETNSVCWLAVKNEANTEVADSKTIRSKLLNDFCDFHPLLKELISKSTNFIQNDIADLGTESRKWYHRKLVFIGDAIHATTPNLAQGGCQAIEDAFCLSSLMTTIRNDFSDIFPMYQGMRNKKVAFIIKTSWQFGKMMDSQFKVKCIKLFFRYVPHRYFIMLEKKLNDLSYLNPYNTK